MTRLPAFLYIGSGKPGSTWLHGTTALHPEVYLSVRGPSPPEPPLPAGSRWWAPAMWTDYRRMIF
ncbi:MAG: hypothetical protein ACLQDY_27910 [Streptosporangiaceae bacterium]